MSEDAFWDDPRDSDDNGIPEWVSDVVLKIRTGIPITWPDLEAEFWEHLRDAIWLATHDRAVAHAAAKRIGVNPPAYANEVIKHIKLHIGDLCRERDGGQAAPDSREWAEEHSRTCPDCFGQGMTYRFRHNHDPATEADTVSCYCRCPMGRWTLAALHKCDPHQASRIVDLAKYPWLQMTECEWSDSPDNKYRHRPEDWDATTNRPRIATYRPWDGGKFAQQTVEAIKQPKPPEAKPQPLAPQKQAALPLSPVRPPSPGLTKHQAEFLDRLGPHWAAKLESAGRDRRGEILASVAEGFSQSDLTATVRSLETL